MKNSSDSLLIVNADGSQRYVSPASERTTGFSVSELEGKTLDTIIHPDDIANVILFLLSDGAQFITGQAINVDGGDSYL